MLKWTMWLAAGGLAAGFANVEAAPRGPAPIIQNFNAPGNLESNYKLGCIALKDARPLYNPVDLMKGSRACIDGHRYADAARLFALAGAYGHYDTRRVRDRTAHQAVIVARMEIFDGVSAADSQKFNEAMKALLADAAMKSAFCGEVSRIGPPSYFPRYMIQHGMGAFLGGANGLVENVDSKSAWAETLSTFLTCPPS